MVDAVKQGIFSALLFILAGYSLAFLIVLRHKKVIFIGQLALGLVCLCFGLFFTVLFVNSMSVLLKDLNKLFLSIMWICL